MAPELEAIARAADGATRDAAFVKKSPETLTFYAWTRPVVTTYAATNKRGERHPVFDADFSMENANVA